MTVVFLLFWRVNLLFKVTFVNKFISGSLYVVLSGDFLLFCSVGRGVFSCIEFDKGDFLLEYRGELISKEQCEQRQRIYHDALKVFMFDFRYNGKLLWYVQLFDVDIC